MRTDTPEAVRVSSCTSGGSTTIPARSAEDSHKVRVEVAGSNSRAPRSAPLRRSRRPGSAGARDSARGVGTMRGLLVAPPGVSQPLAELRPSAWLTADWRDAELRGGGAVAALVSTASRTTSRFRSRGSI